MTVGSRYCSRRRRCMPHLFRPALRGAVLISAMLSPMVAAADCPEPKANADLLIALEEATTAFGRLEIETFNAAANEAAAVVGCLAEAISRPSAAEFHRVQGLALFLGRNSPAAQLSFAAARSVEPEYVFPTDLVPDGNPIRVDYKAIDPKVGPFELANAPKSGSLRLNGSRSLNRATPLPVIFQRLDGRGAVVQTVVVGPGEPLPTFQTGSDGSSREPRVARSGPHIPLLIGSGVALAAAGGLYAGAFMTKTSIGNSEVIADFEGKRQTANTLTLGAGGAAVVGIGLGATSFLVSGSF